MKEVANFINGEWVKTGNTFENVNPVNCKTIALIHEAKRDTVDQAVEAGKAAMKGTAGLTAKLAQEMMNNMETSPQAPRRA